jgi:hypothetical protein
MAIATEPAGFGEFRSGAFALASEGIGGGKIGMGKRVLRVGDARLFEPEDRLVNARFEQMGLPNPE